MNCGCAVCRERKRGYHHSIDHGDELKDGSWGTVKKFLDENSYSTRREDSWRKIKVFLDENYICPEYEEPKRDDYLAFTRSKIFYC